MLEDHAKIAAIIKQAGVIAGRKKLQKMIYILQTMGFPFHETFHFNFFGPHSDELTMQLEELCNFGFLLEHPDEESDGITYRYRLSEAGEGFIGHYKEILPDVRNMTEKLSGESASFLELVSTLLYFDQIPGESANEKVRALDRPFSDKEIGRARVYIADLQAERADLSFSK
ncbi:hypothetical protein E4665_10175 [Sporolactobacillus shoreae]|uniref:YwgA family protein n=1 Tax=Sporolactobacillus shoreae TaxID=1465501 RepID=A0A4Z0GMH5_9BACL|nr:hypothetical protein [Sporolactobacillus shoreae]TGA98019.1 hypothetical protein E4665_10175 [Sporolactobacillus shoreae]